MKKGKKDARSGALIGRSRVACQPRSRSSGSVRSFGLLSVVVRSGLMLGSISRFGKAEMSQWETEEPVTYGLGAYSSGRPAESIPARLLMSTPPLA